MTARHFDLVDRLQARVALLAIGRSALRNQGARGVVLTARKYLRSLDLREFSVRRRSEFETALDKHTRRLMNRFPNGAKGNWGAARKALNIFLRDIVYASVLAKNYRLSHLEPWLELPLDGKSYEGLAADYPGEKALPDWPGVKGLTPRVSGELQAAADVVAKKLRTFRVHLDVKYWRKEEIDALA